MTAVFELEDGTEKSFMRSVQGSSSEHRINNIVSFLLGYPYIYIIKDTQIIFCYSLSAAKDILANWSSLVLMLKQRIF